MLGGLMIRPDLLITIALCCVASDTPKFEFDLSIRLVFRRQICPSQVWTFFALQQRLVVVS